MRKHSNQESLKAACPGPGKARRHPVAKGRSANSGARGSYGGSVRSDGGFLGLLLQRIGWEELEGLEARKHRAGRRPEKLSRGRLLAGLLFHYTVSWAGTFREHLFCLFSLPMAESTVERAAPSAPLCGV